jgi:predicted phosphodiesterase
MEIGVLSDTHDNLANLRLGGRRLVVVHNPDP